MFGVIIHPTLMTSCVANWSMSDRPSTRAMLSRNWELPKYEVAANIGRESIGENIRYISVELIRVHCWFVENLENIEENKELIHDCNVKFHWGHREITQFWIFRKKYILVWSYNYFSPRWRSAVEYRNLFSFSADRVSWQGLTFGPWCTEYMARGDRFKCYPKKNEMLPRNGLWVQSL